MLPAINGATTLKSSLEADIAAAGRVGFGCLEITLAKLEEYLRHNSVRDLLMCFEKSRVRPFSINAYDGGTLFDNQAERDTGRQRFRDICALARSIGCRYVVAIPSFLEREGTVPEKEIVRKTSEVLEEYCAIALGYEVRVAFEFLGFRKCSVNNMRMSAQVVKKAAAKNLGLVLDTFHFFISGSDPSALEKECVGKISIVHINDCEDLPKNTLEDKHRLFPGDGVIPLDKILAALKAGGYEGVVSVELFRPEYWAWPPEKTMRMAYDRMSEVLKNVRWK
ncbi:MAG: sugar phosphate isomerase/epimerase [Kiritimatiellae bacterium]|nr:sugar phosphate isomerase/epimerase [Kiritimatiellia bacterium]